MILIRIDNAMGTYLGGIGSEKAELLNAKAGLLALLYRRGICTLRTVAAQWANIAADWPSMELDELVSSIEKAFPDLRLDFEPVVTIMEGSVRSIDGGDGITLSQADEMVDSLNQLSQKDQGYALKAYARITFAREGKVDNYYLPVRFGVGYGSLLEQMGRRLHEYRVDPVKVGALYEGFPADCRKQLKTDMAVFIKESVWEHTWDLLDYFQFHCDIAAKESKLREQVAGMSDRNRDVYLSYGMETISKLRLAVNAPAKETK